MKVVILAGGYGTRISEETDLKPKPMIEIGGKPILWHIMKIYSYHEINEFIICLGYKGYMIKEYFVNYYRHMSDLTVDLQNNNIKIHNNKSEPWKVTLVDTGENVMTGGRLKKITDHIEDGSDFCMTYGDGVANINITDLIKFHKSHGRLATLTATNPRNRFGVLDLDNNDIVKQFQEKPKDGVRYINGGFFVLSKDVLNYIDGNDTVFEEGPLRKLSLESQLKAYKHEGFWQPMDTLRDKRYLEGLWDSKQSPWKLWG